MLEAYGVFKVNRWKPFFRHLYTLIAVTIGFVLFRAETLPEAGMMIAKMFAGWQFAPGFGATLSMLLTPITAIMLPIAAFASLPFGGRLSLALEKRGGFAEASTYIIAFVGLLIAALCLSTSAYNPFIYFRF